MSKIVEIDGVKYKDCSKCKAPKKLSEFGPCKRSSDGLSSWCKSCRNAWFKDYKKKRKVAGVPVETCRKTRNGGELDYFTKLGLTSFIEGFTKVFKKAEEEYLCDVKSPYREQLEKLLNEIFSKCLVPAIKERVPYKGTQLYEELRKLQQQLLEKNDKIEVLEEKLRDEREYRQDLQKGVRAI